jgi:hypothetical protein
VRVVISTRESSGINRSGLGMRIYRSRLPQSCVCPDIGFSENTGTVPLPRKAFARLACSYEVGTLMCA